MDIEAIVEGRLAVLRERFGWTDLRVAAFREGLADFRAGLPAREFPALDPDASFDDAHCTPAEIARMGYLGGRSAGESYVTDATDFSDELVMRQEAEAWSGNRDADFDMDASTWEFSTAAPIETFLSVMGREEWITWLVEEDRSAKEDLRYGYADLVVEDIKDAVVYVVHEDGKVDVWDGWHRIAAAFAKGETHVPTIAGRPAPAPAPSP